MLKKSIVIDAPISLVWQHLTCPKLMTAWMPGIRAMRSADGGKARLGGILVFTVRAGERESEIIAFDPGRAFALRAIDGKEAGRASRRSRWARRWSEGLRAEPMRAREGDRNRIATWVEGVGRA